MSTTSHPTPQTSTQISVISPVGYGPSNCGYCSPPGLRSNGSSYVIRLSPITLTCKDYQTMIDRGWRRSGNNCYKPDLRRSCCPQYTIRLDAVDFHPTRSQRKVVNRWNRFILFGSAEEDLDAEPKGSGKSKKTSSFSLVDSIHASEQGYCPKGQQPKHKFEVTLEPSGYTDEKYALSRIYQAQVHCDEFSKQGFTRFLCDTRLEPSPIPLPPNAPPHLPRTYGTYHQLYRLDGKLVALSVLDILPGCVSSVYFMYDPQWERFSFGKLSAMRESVLAKELHEQGLDELKHLYMGFYVHSCQKMRYKGEYSPSFLLDPEAYTWYPLDPCVRLLEQYRYACFSQPEKSLKRDKEIPELSRPGPVYKNDLAMIMVHSHQRGLELLLSSPYWENAHLRMTIVRVIEGLGWELAKTMVFHVDGST